MKPEPPPSSPARPRLTAGKLFRALRTFSLPVSVLPVLVATAAVLPMRKWRWDVLVASALGAALLHAVGNLLNDYYDYLSRVDRRTHDDQFRPGRLLVHGQLLPADVLAEALLCLLAAALLAGYLVWRCGAGLMVFGLGAVAAAYAYTGPPFQLKYRALGEPLIFVVFGPLLLTGAAWAQTGRFEPPAFLLSLPVGLTTTAILVANNFRDRQEDAQAGIRTLGHFAGGRVAQVAYLVLVAAGVLGPPAIAAVGLGPPALALAPLALVAGRKPIAAIWKGDRLPHIDAQTARFETVLLLLVLAACLLQPPP